MHTFSNVLQRHLLHTCDIKCKSSRFSAKAVHLENLYPSHFGGILLWDTIIHFYSIPLLIPCCWSKCYLPTFSSSKLECCTGIKDTTSTTTFVHYTTCSGIDNCLICSSLCLVYITLVTLLIDNLRLFL